MTNNPARGLVSDADRDAARVFVAHLHGRYDVEAAIVFGSRARGEARPDSDLDLAVVLRGARGNFVGTKRDMAGTAFDAMMETGILVQALPLWEGDLDHPERFPNPALIRAVARDGVRVA